MKSTWIWYPGDYEIWLGNKMNNRRTERGAFFPPFWKTDSHYVCVEFSKEVSLEKAETISIAAEGQFNLKFDGKLQFGMPTTFEVPAGRHKINIKVHNQATPPALFVSGETIHTDATWKVTYEDKEWIDESGKASDTSATIYMDAGCWNFDSAEQLPSKFQLARETHKAVSVEKVSGGRTQGPPLQAKEQGVTTPTVGAGLVSARPSNGLLVDFGRETFGYLTLNGIKGNRGVIHIYYGESPEEAQDKEHCETLDKLAIDEWKITDLSTNVGAGLVSARTSEFGYESIGRTQGPPLQGESYTIQNSKAFRYVYIETEGDIIIGEPTMEYEFLPEEYRGSFRCNDEEINKIWDVGAYTMHITTREFFIDGIKRDRWVWSGDAIQSYLMNYYLFFDAETVKRTIWLLRGKDPVTAHTNTIMDYTFYWFKSIADYWLYTGDRHFVSQIYPRMKTMMDYVLGRTNKDGMVEGMTGDWVFVDWADFPMSKTGALSFEQILFCKSLETMELCAGLLGEKEDEAKYKALAEALRAKLLPTFWDEERQALIHNVENGGRTQGPPLQANEHSATSPTNEHSATSPTNEHNATSPTNEHSATSPTVGAGLVSARHSVQVNKFANMFAIILDYLTEEQKQTVMQSVMLNPEIPAITTPYMRFYELEAICQRGMQAQVLPEIKAYWGGMLREGATTFWEKYVPTDHGTEHLAMYGRPYGKSLCHAWGASPIYLLGKYFLGVEPTKPGYEEYTVKPCLGGLEWMEGSVPTPLGDIHIKMTKDEISVLSPGGRGTLVYNGKTYEIPAGETRIEL